MQGGREVSGLQLRYVGLVIVLGVSVGLMLVLGAVRSAQAHDTPANCWGVYYGGIQRGVACTQSNHGVLDGCDRAVDGLKARAWSFTTHYVYFVGGWDPNGGKGGCRHDDLVGTGNGRSVLHRICVEHPVGCRDWASS
jgi:hypothetical protein